MLKITYKLTSKRFAGAWPLESKFFTCSSELTLKFCWKKFAFMSTAKGFNEGVQRSQVNCEHCDFEENLSSPRDTLNCEL